MKFEIVYLFKKACKVLNSKDDTYLFFKEKRLIFDTSDSKSVLRNPQLTIFKHRNFDKKRSFLQIQWKKEESYVG